MSEITHSYGRCTITTPNKDSLEKLLLLMTLRYHNREYNIKIVELANKGYYDELQPDYPLIDEFVRKHFNIEENNITFDIEATSRYTFDDNVKSLLQEILKYNYQYYILNTYRDKLIKEHIKIELDVEEVRLVDGLSWQTNYTITSHNKEYTCTISER